MRTRDVCSSFIPLDKTIYMCMSDRVDLHIELIPLDTITSPLIEHTHTHMQLGRNIRHYKVYTNRSACLSKTFIAAPASVVSS